jgi:hypothetical protein
LPKNIQEVVRGRVNKDGMLNKGALDKIRSEDANFLDLKAVVNGNRTIEVLTAPKDGSGKEFYYESPEQAKAQIIKNIIRDGGTERDALDLIAANPSYIAPAAISGHTTDAKDSPNGIIRVTLADGTGKANGITKDIMVKTAAHELYGHALLQSQGKPWKHDDGGPVDTHIGGIEKRTMITYEQNQKLSERTKSNTR